MTSISESTIPHNNNNDNDNNNESESDTNPIELTEAIEATDGLFNDNDGSTTTTTHSSSNNNMTKPSETTYRIVVGVFAVYSIVFGYIAGLQPINAWRSPFSWHPFLMTVSMIGAAGIGAITKKMGGYVNTKNHAILGWTCILGSFGGLYAIYHNKNINGADHFTSYHGKAGVAVIGSCFALGMVGSVVLHPDFGMDKTNGTIRSAHKYASRATLMAAWSTACYGLYQMNVSNMLMLLYALPLLILVPFVLL